MKRWQIFLFVFLTLLMISGAGYWGFRETNPFAQTETQELLEVPPTVAVTHGDVKKTIITPGQLVNYRTINIVAGTTGKVGNINVHPGDTVQADELLAKLDGYGQQEANVGSAKIALLEAQRQIDELHNQAAFNKAEALNTIETLQQSLAALYEDLGQQQIEAELVVIQAQRDVKKAEYILNSLLNGRGDARLIAEAKSKYLVAQAQVDHMKQIYNETPGDPENDVAKAQALADLEGAKRIMNRALASLNWYLGKPSDLELAESKANLALAQEKLTIAQSNLEEVLTGPDKYQATLLETQLAQAQSAYESLDNGTDPSALSMAEANLEMAKLNLLKAEAEIEALEIRAPFNGVILRVPVQVGDMIVQGNHVIQMADPQALDVLVSIVEEDFPLVEVGQKVELYFDAAPDLDIIGQVKSIIPMRFDSSLPQYQVYIAIDSVPGTVVDGMTVDAAIILENQNNVLRLPRGLVHAGSDGTATVSVWAGNHAEERLIIVGLRGDTYTEILSGLEEGELVVGQ